MQQQQQQQQQQAGQHTKKLPPIAAQGAGGAKPDLSTNEKIGEFLFDEGKQRRGKVAAKGSVYQESMKKAKSVYV